MVEPADVVEEPIAEGNSAHTLAVPARMLAATVRILEAIAHTLCNQQERRYVEASARILVALDHLTTRSMFRKRTNGEARVRR